MSELTVPIRYLSRDQVENYVTELQAEVEGLKKRAWADEERLIDGMAAIYASDKGSSTIAFLCDEHIDKSGALLGVVRNRAMEAKKNG